MLRHVTSPDGVRIACEVSGEGPPVVFVHGAGSARWSFEPVRPLLEGSFTVIAIDRRGRGDSSDGDDYRVESEFEDVAGVVRDAGEAALLVGHSYGALIAAGAAQHIEGLPRLVLYEPPMGGALAERHNRPLGDPHPGWRPRRHGARVLAPRRRLQRRGDRPARAIARVGAAKGRLTHRPS